MQIREAVLTPKPCPAQELTVDRAFEGRLVSSPRIVLEATSENTLAVEPRSVAF